MHRIIKNVDNMVVSDSEERILFGVTKLYSSLALILLLHDTKTRTIEKIVVAFKNSGYSRVYFVDHSIFKGGFITAVSFIRNKIKVLTRNDKKNYTISKFIPFNFDDALLPCHCFLDPITNKNNQVLSFLNHRIHVAVYDLFDISNSDIFERVEVVEWNKRWSPPFPYCPVSCQCP